MLHHAVHSSIRVQNKLIKNYSNGCWVFKKKSASRLVPKRNTVVAIVWCLGS